MILVTGGTGLVGSHLLYFLLKENRKVRAIKRKTSDLSELKKVFAIYTNRPEKLLDKIEWVTANITEIPSLTQAFKDITHVYHCAAYISFDPKHYRKLKKNNVEGTANIVNLSLAYNIKKLCYVSSVSTLGHTIDSSAINEETDWNPEENNNVYAITKYGAEMEVWRGVQEGLNAVIVNPGIILGEGYWNSGSGMIVKNAAKGVKFYTHGATGFVDVIDVVQMMQKLMNDNHHSERYILVGTNKSYKEFFEQFSVYFSKPPPTKVIGKRMLLYIRKLDYLLSVLFGKKRRLLKPMVLAMFTYSKYDASKVTTHLDMTFTELDETLSRVAKNYCSWTDSIS